MMRATFTINEQRAQDCVRTVFDCRMTKRSGPVFIGDYCAI
jgi:hypothetical protein